MTSSGSLVLSSALTSLKQFANMFGFITKKQYWSYLDDQTVVDRLDRTTRRMICLKHIQDSWILAQLGSLTGKRIIEVGGGFGRVLRTLDPSNERWNLDIPAGPGRTVTEKLRKMPPEYTVVGALLGEFSDQLPSDYFDVAFSISVIEHVPAEAIGDFWKDHARILKPGGTAFHAIDLYLGDQPIQANEERLDSYMRGIRAAGLEFIMPPQLERPITFRCEYATNPDLAMKEWNEIAPSLTRQREVRQSVSLAVGISKSLD